MNPVTAAWIGLMAGVVGLELLSRRAPTRVVSTSAIVRRWWSHPIGRCALLSLWAFAGVHLFARYSVPA